MNENIFKDFWQNELNQHKNQITDQFKSTIKFCFDYNQATIDNVEKITFNKSNWNDYGLSKLRDFLDNVKYSQNRSFENEEYKVIYNFNNDQNNFYFLSKCMEPDFIISIYKNRGKIEHMINVNENKPITLDEMTLLYFNLNLSKNINDQDIDYLYTYY